MKSPMLRIAAAEWQHLLRTRLAVAIIIILTVLAAASALSTAHQMVSESQSREAYQRAAEEAFRNQPARHPHRMVHYGHYVFRAPAPLAVIDPGVDPFTGRSIFLEGHRRNSATFAEARETSVLTRLGVVSPTFAVQVIAPLLLILLGFASMVRERQRGTLLQLIAQGVPASSLVAGKALAIGSVALLALLPMLITALWIILRQPAEALPGITLLAANGAYLAFWVLLIVAVSSFVRQARSALILLMIIWACTTIVVPRVATDVAAIAVPALTQTEMDIMVQREMRSIGDSHNINDPAFVSFEQQVLDEYGVADITDLPINFRGLVSLHAEAEGSAMINRFSDQLHEIQRQQSRVMTLFAGISPYLAVRTLSMRSAGTDLQNQHRFLDAAEAHRFDLIQALNTLHMHELDFADDAARSRDQQAEQRTRISADFWQQLQDFHFAPLPATARLGSALPLLLITLCWLLLGALIFRKAVVRTQQP